MARQTKYTERLAYLYDTMSSTLKFTAHDGVEVVLDIVDRQTTEKSYIQTKVASAKVRNMNIDIFIIYHACISRTMHLDYKGVTVMSIVRVNVVPCVCVFVSLVPRPSRGGESEGLVSTACARARFPILEDKH